MPTVPLVPSESKYKCSGLYRGTAETQSCIRLASHLVREPLTSKLEDVSSKPLCGHEPGTLIKTLKTTYGVQYF
jgi:hypothetical protein